MANTHATAKQNLTFADMLKHAQTAGGITAKPTETENASVPPDADAKTALPSDQTPSTDDISNGSNSAKTADANVLDTPPTNAAATASNNDGVVCATSSTANLSADADVSTATLGKTEESAGMKPTHSVSKAKSVSHHKPADNGAVTAASSNTIDVNATQAPPAAQVVPVQNVSDAMPKMITRGKPTPSKAVEARGPALKVVSGAVSEQPAAVTPTLDPTRAVAAPSHTIDDTPMKDEEADHPGALFASKVVTAPTSGQVHLTPPEVQTSHAGAGFRMLLQDVIRPANASTAEAMDTTVQGLATVMETNATPQLAPVIRHLEVAVNDPMFGDIGVRAEMRAGSLHASISGAGDIAAVVPQLHQYLQQHDIALHSVSFTSAADSVRPQIVAAAATSSFGGGMDSSSSNQSNAQQQGDERTSTPAWKGASAGNSGDSFDDRPKSPVSTPVFNALHTDSRLSIHI